MRLAVDWSRTPDLIVSDLRLRGAHNGEAVVAWLREEFNEDIPAVIMTGDVVTPTTRTVRRMTVLHKPVAASTLAHAALELLDAGQTGTTHAAGGGPC